MTVKLERHANADGTFNGVAIFAELTGLPSGEIIWMWTRTRELLQAGVPKGEVGARIEQERRDALLAGRKPWVSA